MTQREFIVRAAAIGGLVLVAGFTVVASLMGAIVERTAGILGCSAVVALICLVIAAKIWHDAPDDEGEDLFSGRKGLLLTLTIVYVMTFTVIAAWMVTNADAWKGFVEGWRR